jgi:hypothetical protein
MRSVLSVLAGVVTAIVVIMLVQLASSVIFPLPAGIDPTNRDSMAAYVRAMSAGTYVMVILSYALGSLAGGYVASMISLSIQTAMVVGGIQSLMGIINLVSLPHPLWFTVVCMLVYLPFAFVGGWFRLR